MHESDPSGLLSVLLGTSAAVGILDEELRLKWASRPYLELLAAGGDPLNRPLTDFAGRGANLPFYEAVEATLADGVRRTVRNYSGDYQKVFDNVITRSGDSVVVEVTDATSTVQAEEQERLARSAQDAITEHMQEAVVMIDFQQGTVLTNQPCVDTFGDFSWLRDFVATGRPLAELELGFPIDDPEGRLRKSFEVGLRVMQTGEPFRGVLEMPTLRGTRVFQVVSSRWEHDGQTRGLIDIKTDITDAVTAQRELETQKQELVSLTLVKHFAQGVAHDSGNVAQVVKGYAQLLQSNPTPEVLNAAVEGLISVAQRSVRLAHDVSEVARIGEVSSTPIRLNELISLHLPALQRTVGEHVQVSFSTSADPVVTANEGQLHSILDNLCENAARAMNWQGSTDICLFVADGRAILQVGDDGPGLPDELSGRLFEPFSSSASSRAAGGTGLGLYLVREYLKSLHGDVTVATSPAGTTFTLSIPVTHGEDESPEAPR